MMLNERVVEELPVPLTPEELQARGQELAAKIGELHDVDELRKSVAKVHKDRCDEIETEIADLGSVIRNKSEDRPIECVWEADFDRATMVLFRGDTHQVVRSRPMTDEEIEAAKQMKLKIHEGGRRQRADTDA